MKQHCTKWEEPSVCVCVFIRYSHTWEWGTFWESTWYFSKEFCGSSLFERVFFVSSFNLKINYKVRLEFRIDTHSSADETLSQDLL